MKIKVAKPIPGSCRYNTMVFENKKEFTDYLVDHCMNGPEWIVNFQRDSVSKIAENMERVTELTMIW